MSLVGLILALHLPEGRILRPFDHSRSQKMGEKMKKSVLVVTLAVVGFGNLAQAQVAGCITTPDNPCIIDGPDHGGGHPVDPSPYDPPAPYDPYDPYPPRPHQPPQPPRPPRPPQPPRPPHDGYQELVSETIRIDRFVRNERLDLTSLLGRNFRLDGLTLEAIVVEGQTGFGGGSAMLLIDGNREDSQWLSSHMVLRSFRQVTLGRYGNRIELFIDSKFYVRQVTIQARRSSNPGYPPGYGDQVLRRSVYQTFYGFGTLDVGRFFDLWSLRGQRLSEVIVRARANGPGRSFGSLRINSFQQGGFQPGGFTQEFRIPVRGQSIIGQGADSIVLDVENMVIEEISLRVSR